MKSEYVGLKSLENHHGYKILEALWIHELTEVEKARDSAAKRGGESAWRYWAGQEKGFKLAMTQLQRALVHMEHENEDLKDGTKIEDLLSELRGEVKQ